MYVQIVLSTSPIKVRVYGPEVEVEWSYVGGLAEVERFQSVQICAICGQCLYGIDLKIATPRAFWKLRKKLGSDITKYWGCKEKVIFQDLTLSPLL